MTNEERLARARPIFDKYDLGSRSDGVLEGSIALLCDAAEMMRRAAFSRFEQQAATEASRQLAFDAIQMAQDALLLGSFDDRKTRQGGVVTQDSDGGYVWSPK
jgi:hypothetical protein